MASLEKTMQIQETIYSSHFGQLQTLNDEFVKFTSSQMTLTKSNLLSQQLLNSAEHLNSTANSNNAGNTLTCLTILQQQQITNLVETTFDDLMTRRHHGVVTDDSLKTVMDRHARDLRDNIANAVNVSHVRLFPNTYRYTLL